MKTGLFHSIARIESLAAILLLMTIGLAIAYQSLTQELVVNAQTENWTTSCGDDRSNGGKSFIEDLSDSEAFRFSYTTEKNDRTSYAVFLISPPGEDGGFDLDWFSEIKIRARAEGTPRQQFLIHLRDRPDHFSGDDNDSRSYKYNEALMELSQQPQTITLLRDNFMVPRWWVAEKSVLPKDASVSFSNIQWIEIAVCRANHENSGVVVIDEISFHGPMISTENFYSLLAGIWSLMAIPLCFRIYSSLKKARTIRRIRRDQMAQQESGSKADFAPPAALAKTSDTGEILRNDELSGLLTSFGIQDDIDSALQAVRSGNDQANIILIDIDDLEMLNRTSGRAAGDEVIRQVASVIKENLSEGQTACRWSDDKFLIVCKGRGRDDSRKFACHLRKQIEEETPTTCSFGVHRLNPINTFEEAYQRATKCVQEAKFNGKNKVVLFNLRSTSAPITTDTSLLGQSPASNSF